MAAACRNIVLCAAVRAAFETEAVVTLLAMPFIIFQPALTATAIVLDDVAVFGAFAPKQVGKTAARAKDLHRLAV
ncbi:hypothetical protein D3C80_1754340 [compost metagenome]